MYIFGVEIICASTVYKLLQNDTLQTQDTNGLQNINKNYGICYMMDMWVWYECMRAITLNLTIVTHGL